MTEREDDSQVSEGELIALILAGDRSQFRHIVARYKDRVFGTIMRQTGDRAIAEDLSQEVFLKAFRGLQSFRQEASFATWLTRITLNTTSSYFASKQHRERRNAVELQSLANQSDRHYEQDELLQEHIALFRSCLAKLSERFRGIISLCGLEEQSYEEAAAVLGIPVGTVRSRLHKARVLLKDCMLRSDQEGG